MLSNITTKSAVRRKIIEDLPNSAHSASLLSSIASTSQNKPKVTRKSHIPTLETNKTSTWKNKAHENDTKTSLQKRRSTKRKSRRTSLANESLGIIGSFDSNSDENLPQMKSSVDDAKKVSQSCSSCKTKGQDSGIVISSMNRQHLLEIESSLQASLEIVRQILYSSKEVHKASAEDDSEPVSQDCQNPLIDHCYSAVLPDENIIQVDLEDNQVKEMECEVISCIDVDAMDQPFPVEHSDDSFTNLEMKLNIVHDKQRQSVPRIPLNPLENTQQANPVMREYLSLRTGGGILTTPKATHSLRKQVLLQTPRTKISSTIMKQLENLYDGSF